MRKLPLTKISLPAVMLIYDKKTGAYTYEMPSGFGLIVSNVGKKEILKMKPALRMYGAAFQIQDDFLNLKASKESGYGKEFADDILEGKWTIFAERAEKLLKGRDLEKFHAIYGNRSASVEKRKELVEIFDSNGVFDQAMKFQREVWKKAKTRVEKFIPKTEKGKELIEVLDFGCDRTK